MTKRLTTTLVILCMVLSSTAQKGKNHIGIGGEIGIPAGKEFSEEFNTGFGGWVKFHIGVGKTAGQVTFSSGYTRYKAKGSGSIFSATVGFIPMLLGYKHTIAGGFYAEPQAGYGSYQATFSQGGQSVSGSQGAFTYAVGVGYNISALDFGLRFQNATIEGISYGNVALRVGYNFAFKSK